MFSSSPASFEMSHPAFWPDCLVLMIHAVMIVVVYSLWCCKSWCLFDSCPVDRFLAGFLMSYLLDKSPIAPEGPSSFLNPYRVSKVLGKTVGAQYILPSWICWLSCRNESGEWEVIWPEWLKQTNCKLEMDSYWSVQSDITFLRLFMKHSSLNQSHSHQWAQSHPLDPNVWIENVVLQRVGKMGMSEWALQQSHIPILFCQD